MDKLTGFKVMLWRREQMDLWTVFKNLMCPSRQQHQQHLYCEPWGFSNMFMKEMLLCDAKQIESFWDLKNYIKYEFQRQDQLRKKQFGLNKKGPAGKTLWYGEKSTWGLESEQLEFQSYLCY